MEYPFWVNNFDRVKDHRLAYPSVAKTVVTSMMD